MQVGKDGMDQHISYFSKNFDMHQRISIILKECLALILAL